MPPKVRVPSIRTLTLSLRGRAWLLLECASITSPGAGTTRNEVRATARRLSPADPAADVYAGAMADNDHDHAASRREITDALIAALDRRHEVLDVIVDAD